MLPTDDGLLDVEERFATTPEWLLFAPISDRAKVLYAVIQRFGNTSGARMPGRAAIAALMNNTSRSSISRAIAELEEFGALRVTRSFRPGSPVPNRYYLCTSAPAGTETASSALVDYPTTEPIPPDVVEPHDSESQDVAHATQCPEPATDTAASTPAAYDDAEPAAAAGSAQVDYPSTTSGLGRPPVRHNRENNQIPPPTPSPSQTEGEASPSDELDELLGEPLIRLVDECRRIRTDRGLPLGAWTLPKVLRAIADAVIEYDPAAVPAALRALAADPETAVPGRLKGAGPWWNTRTAKARGPRSCDECDNGWLPADPSDDLGRPVRCSRCHPAVERAS